MSAESVIISVRASATVLRCFCCRGSHILPVRYQILAGFRLAAVGRTRHALLYKYCDTIDLVFSELLQVDVFFLGSLPPLFRQPLYRRG